MPGKLEINGKSLICELAAEVQIDGVWLNADQAAGQGFPLQESVSECRRIRVKNQSKKTVRLGGFRWHHAGHRGDFLHAPGRSFRIYAEGWMMASPCGVKKFGDREFNYDIDFMPFAICRPDECSDRPNHFHAENMTAILNGKTGEILLAGFVTSAHQFGRFLIDLDEEGVSDFSLISDCDGRELDPGETAESEELAFFFGDDLPSLQNRFADLWGAKMKARKKYAPPFGWCSWYYYFDRVRENDVLENVRWFAAHRTEFPVEYIQLDDGYQSALGDWLTCNEKFPNGLKDLAEKIRRAGFRPAIWLAPFSVEENSILLREHPEWMVKDADGQVIFPARWRENHKIAVLDGTHPEVQDHFRRLFRTLREWGWDYVKLDFMVYGTAKGIRFDRKATRAEALRRGIEAIREGFGEEGFILGCTVPFGPMAGVVDGERISTDITPCWGSDRLVYNEAPAVPNVCRNVIHHAYMNHRLWINDPDTHIARIDNNELAANEVKLWTEAVRLGGGMLLFSDRFETLTPERAVYSKSLIADQDCYVSLPLDAFREAFPRLWLGKHKQTGERRLGVFNFDDSAAGTELFRSDLKGEAVMLTETATGEVFELKDNSISIPVPPHSVRMFKVETA